MYGIEELRKRQLFDPIDVGGGYDIGFNPVYEPEMDFQVGVPSTYNPSSLASQPTDIQQLRQQSVQAPQVDPNAALDRTMAAIDRVYTPSYVDRDRYRGLMDRYPEFQQPSGLSRWSAGLMALGERSRQGGDPLKVMDQVLLGDYGRQVDDWKLKQDAYAKAAQMENTANVNERTLAGNVVQAQTQADRLAQQDRIANERLENERRRIEILQFKQQNPNMKFDFSGPEAFAYDPANPTRRISLGPTGKLSDFDKITLQNEGRVEAARVGAGAAMDRTIASGATVMQPQEGGPPVYVNPRAGSAATPIPGTTGPLQRPGTDRQPIQTAKEDEAQKQRRWAEIIDINPQWQKFVGRNPKGEIVLRPRPTMGSWLRTDAQDAAEIAEYDRMMQTLYPNYRPPTPTPTPTPTPGAAPQGKISPMSREQQQAGVQAGQLLEVVDANGRPVGTVPNTAAGRAEAARLGYRVR